MIYFDIVERVSFQPCEIIDGVAGGDGASLTDYQALPDPWPVYSRNQVVRARKIVAVGVQHVDVYTAQGWHDVRNVVLHFDAEDLDDNIKLEPESPVLDGLFCDYAKLPGCYYVIHEDLTTEIVRADAFEREYSLD